MRCSPHSFRLHRAIVALIVLGVAGCAADDDIQGPDPLPNVAGSWSGTISFTNQGRTAGMELRQAADAVTGTLRITGSVLNAPLDGQFDAFERMVWASQDGCELWSGRLALSADGSTLEGPAQVDQTACNGGTITTATMRLTRS